MTRKLVREVTFRGERRALNRKWQRRSIELLQQVYDVADALSDYLPLTVRQVFYQLVGRYLLVNTRNSYQKVGRLLRNAREDGDLPWEWIEDRSRQFHQFARYRNLTHFLDMELEYFLEGYHRDPLQTQAVAIELWSEKDALYGFFERVATRYRVPVLVSRGFLSVDFLNKFVERARELYDRDGRQTVVLYAGDHDPSGVCMPEHYQRVFEDKLGDTARLERVALTIEQVEQFALPTDPEAAKPDDPRFDSYVKRFGTRAWELDALPPDVLMGLLEDAVTRHIDVDLVEQETATQDVEDELLLELKDAVEAFTRQWLEDRDMAS